MIDKILGLFVGAFAMKAASKNRVKKYAKGGSLQDLDLCVYNTQMIMNEIIPIMDSFIHDNKLVIIFSREITVQDADIIEKAMNDYKVCDDYVDSEPNFDLNQPTVVYFKLLMDSPDTFQSGGLTRADFNKQFVVYGETEGGYRDILGMSDTSRGANMMVAKYLKKKGFGDYVSVGFEKVDDFYFQPSIYKYRVGGVTLLEKNQLEKAFHLPLEMAIYVPSTWKVDLVIPEDLFRERVQEVSEYLSELFGGYTSQQTLGGYVSENGELVKEDVVKVTAFATESAFKTNQDKLIRQVQKWAKDWEQEAIGVEFEGDLFYVPRTFAKGGKLGFEGLAKKVANNYEGKMVKPSYQSEYGVRYDRDEALEVGRKVAAKVYRQQLSKKG
jgi:hypothetical protein